MHILARAKARNSEGESIVVYALRAERPSEADEKGREFWTLLHTPEGDVWANPHWDRRASLAAFVGIIEGFAPCEVEIV